MKKRLIAIFFVLLPLEITSQMLVKPLHMILTHRVKNIIAALPPDKIALAAGIACLASCIYAQRKKIKSVEIKRAESLRRLVERSIDSLPTQKKYHSKEEKLEAIMLFLKEKQKNNQLNIFYEPKHTAAFFIMFTQFKALGNVGEKRLEYLLIEISMMPISGNSLQKYEEKCLKNFIESVFSVGNMYLDFLRIADYEGNEALQTLCTSCGFVFERMDGYYLGILSRNRYEKLTALENNEKYVENDSDEYKIDKVWDSIYEDE